MNEGGSVTHAIETVDLARRFRGQEAVHSLTLQVPAGSFFALVGPNGAGKTTTIKMLMNLIRPSNGSATVLGTDTRKLGPRDFQRIGYVSESQELPDLMTPDQLLAYVRPFYPTWDTALCEKLQRDLGLATRTPLKRLSRGTRMKAALLASLAYRPELLMLDEPFTGLDPLVRDELIRALLELPGERPFTVFVSSHDIDEVERLADWIGFLDRGRLVFAEPVSTLLGRFRLVEVVTPDGSSPTATMQPTWIGQGMAGRTLRFVDTQHDADAAMTRIASAYPGADIRVVPLSLREIFVALARRSATSDSTRAEAS
jgi:ABC-2 type transport system ATP-binding protein